MSLFLLTFVLIYGGVHAYAFLKIKAVSAPGPAVSVLIFVLCITMVAGPVLVRVAERHGFEGLASALAHTTYTWMGFIFLFFSAAIALDLYHLLLTLLGKSLHRDLSPFIPTSAVSCYAALAWGGLVALYGYGEAHNIRVERLTIATSKLPATMDKLVIAQISDLHLGLMVGKDRLTQVIGKIKLEKPDVVVSTGDLVDGQLDGLAELAPLFAGLTPPLGKYAVLGNHEVYAGLPAAISFTEQAGFRLLRNQSATVGETLVLTGVDDPAALRGTGMKHIPEGGILRQSATTGFTLLLKHRPVVEPLSQGLFDLQLSGHVHKGQIFPFNLLTHLFYPVKMGLSTYANGSSLYVSRGTGTWGPPIRFLAPPEITIITLVRSR